MSALRGADFDELHDVVSQLVSLESSFNQIRQRVVTILSRRNEAAAYQLSIVSGLSESGRTAGVLSSSKKRRLRAARTKQKLWRAKYGVETSVNDVDVAPFWEKMESCSELPSQRQWCAFDAPLAQGRNSDLWSVSEIEDWSRRSLRSANEAAKMELDNGSDKQTCLCVRSNLIRQRWDHAKLHFPEPLRDNLLDLLLEDIC